MTQANAKPPQALGFLTVVEHEPHGLFGGYLVLNRLGRPLEFHCTAPVKPNRAQQILYGPTLEAFLYGEQIGQTLIAAAKNKAQVVCTDIEHVLSVADLVDMPVTLVANKSARADGHTPADLGASELRLDGPHGPSLRLAWFRVGAHRLAVPSSRAEQQHKVEAELSVAAEALDLTEPFERIRQAIDEAQRGGR